MKLPKKFDLYVAAATLGANLSSVAVTLIQGEPVLPWLIALGASIAWYHSEWKLLRAKRDVDALTEILFERGAYAQPED